MRASQAIRERLPLFIFLCGFWAVAYFGASRWNASRPAAVLAWDPVRHFPLVSAFVVPYLSAYALPFLTLFTVRDRAAYRRIAAVVGGTIAVSAACFVLWPLTILRPEIAAASVFDRLLGALYAVDRPTNLFPSLHVSLSFLFAAAVSVARPRWRIWMLAWVASIAVSTLFVRQHYMVDVVGGLAAAWIGWRVFLARPR